MGSRCFNRITYWAFLFFVYRTVPAIRPLAANSIRTTRSSLWLPVWGLSPVGSLGSVLGTDGVDEGSSEGWLPGSPVAGITVSASVISSVRASSLKYLPQYSQYQ